MDLQVFGECRCGSLGKSVSKRVLGRDSWKYRETLRIGRDTVQAAIEVCAWE